MKPLIVAIAMLAGCANDPIKLRNVKGRGNCVINATAAAGWWQHLHPYRKAKVLVMEFGTKTGHAVCIFEFGHRIMVRDDAESGSRTIAKGQPELWEQPLAIADKWHTRSLFPLAPVDAYWLDDDKPWLP